MSWESSAAALAEAAGASPDGSLLGAGAGGLDEGPISPRARTTSSRVILPRSPVGCTRLRSTPISSASLRVEGDAGGAPGGWLTAVACAGSPAPGGSDLLAGGGGGCAGRLSPG